MMLEYNNNENTLLKTPPTPLNTTLQLLIRFQNNTHVINVPFGETYSCDNETKAMRDREKAILVTFVQNLSQRPEWRHCFQNSNALELFQVTHYSPPFCSIRLASRVRGGKGGFGTLLKGQSRQAGAKATTDFGACRDLQGRRLRHVNDQLSVQKFQAWREKLARGEATEEDMIRAMIQGDQQHGHSHNGGVVGWHLQLPTWTRVSKQETRKVQRQFRLWRREREDEEADKNRQREHQERQVQSYINTAKRASEQASEALQSALMEGLATAATQRNTKKQKLSNDAVALLPPKETTTLDPPAALVTLSGDAILAHSDELWKIQSQSNFCTVSVILQPANQNSARTDLACTRFYFELGLDSGGLVQVGWVMPTLFVANSDLGNGVGDDAFSWAYDGSRQIKLHGTIGKEQKEKEGIEQYGNLWKQNDVVGSLFDATTREITYFLNGVCLGAAFIVENVQDQEQDFIDLFPAISCNPREVVSLRLYEHEQLYRPKNAIAVGQRMVTEKSLNDVDDNDDDVGSAQEKVDNDCHNVQAVQTPAQAEDAQIASNIIDNGVALQATNVAADVESTAVLTTASIPNAESIDLDAYQSQEELKQLGLDQIKAALQARGLKCGGTLQERVARLWKVKGLDVKDYPPKLLAKQSRQPN